MKITPRFTRLHSGENKSRLLDISVGEELYNKSVRLAFVTPMGRIFISDILLLSEGQAVFHITSSLLDGKGMLLCQLIVSDTDGFICKSPVLEIPVYASVDDMSCPAVSEEGLKSLALIFEALENKADTKHTHDEFYTKEQLHSALSLKSDLDHTHSGYIDKSELDIALSGKADTKHTHDEFYTKEQLHSALSLKSDLDHTHSGYVDKSELDLALSGKADTKHTHEEYTDTATLDLALSEKSDKAHSHDDAYYGKAQTDLLLSGKSDSSHLHEGVYLTRDDIGDILGDVSLPGVGTDANHNHDSIYYTEDEADALLAGKADKDHSHDEYIDNEAMTAALSEKADKEHSHTGYADTDTLNSALSGKADADHSHSDSYYEKAQTDALLSEKSDKTHSHDGLYYDKDSVAELLSGKSDSTHTHDEYMSADEISAYLDGITDNMLSADSVATTVKKNEQAPVSSGAVYTAVNNAKTELKALISSEIEYMTCYVDLSSISLTTSVKYSDIESWVDAGKYVVGKASYAMKSYFINDAFLPLSALNRETGEAIFKGLVSLILTGTTTEAVVDMTATVYESGKPPKLVAKVVTATPI